MKTKRNKVKKGLTEKTVYLIATKMFMENASLFEAVGNRKVTPKDLSWVLDVALRMNTEYIEYLKLKRVLGMCLYESFKEEFIKEAF